MPLYEYICESCGRTIEAFQSFSDAPLSLCDRCGGRLKRLISAPALQFKGSGWYVSDYGRSGAARGSSEGGKPEGDRPKDGGGPAGDTKAAPSKDSSVGTTSSTEPSKTDP
ncbi:MAG: FmdB family zinc ribbon protein [Acidithiobacillales bacterium]